MLIFLGVTACVGEDCLSYNMSFEVNEGKSYCFDDGLIIEITSISNSYCPCNAQCIWEGEAVIEGVRIENDGTRSNFRIHEIMTNASPPWGSISEIITDKECEPSITQISLIISQ